MAAGPSADWLRGGLNPGSCAQCPPPPPARRKGKPNAGGLVREGFSDPERLLPSSYSNEMLGGGQRGVARRGEQSPNSQRSCLHKRRNPRLRGSRGRLGRSGKPSTQLGGHGQHGSEGKRLLALFPTVGRRKRLKGQQVTLPPVVVREGVILSAMGQEGHLRRKL